MLRRLQAAVAGIVFGVLILRGMDEGAVSWGVFVLELKEGGKGMLRGGE